ncbi:MAG TPA: SDR family oxidoreductase [Methylomirabilota bacterium]|nr:SDR family oxidoreductase [Methylomirabilota bacterium]
MSIEHKECIMITVTGATGQLGRLVLESLAARVPASEITAAVRNPDKAGDLAAKGVRVVRADYNDPASLASAFAGTDRLLVISGNEFGQRVEQYERIVAAARQAGVGYIAYTSILRADENPMYLAQDHKAAEALIAASGIPHAFLRNGWYSENYTASMQGGAAHGAFIGAAGAGRIATAPRADYAEAAAVVVAEGREGVFELGGAPFTMDDLAVTISRATGQPVAYRNLPPDVYAAELQGFGVPPGMAQALADSDRHAADGWLDTPSRDLETLIGRPPAPMSETVKALLG